MLFDSEEQKKKYLPDIASGKKLAAFGLTEAGAGSDAGAIRTTATKGGDGYVLNGTKQWITNGGEAETYSVVAITDRAKGPRGASAFIVEKGTPGFTSGKRRRRWGSALQPPGNWSSRIASSRKRTSSAGRHGFHRDHADVRQDPARVGAQAVGVAQGAFEAAVVRPGTPAV